MATNTDAIYNSLVSKYGKSGADAAISAASSSNATKSSVTAAATGNTGTSTKTSNTSNTGTTKSTATTGTVKDTSSATKTTGTTSTTNTTNKVTSGTSNTANTTNTTSNATKNNTVSTYNPNTGYYESSSSSSSNNSLASKVANTWNNKTYEEQQELLKNNPDLQSYLTKAGITNKRANVDTDTATQYNVNTRDTASTPTKAESQWDYQSTDDARTQELINNLDYYKTNMPQLFNDYETFRAAFIDGKGRSASQEAILNQYFFGQQQYNKYNAMTPEEIGEGYVNGTISDDILTMFSSQDPQKYALIQDAVKTAQTKVGNNSYYNSLLEENGFTSTTDSSTGTFEAYIKKLGYTDEDNNGIFDVFDANYKKTDEEIQYENEASDLNSEILNLQKEKRDVLNDLIEQYPGVSLSTLNVMASDMSSDLDDEIWEKTIRLNTLNGYITTLQEDRQLQAQGAQQSLSALNSLYGMYYNYTQEGISSMASMTAQAEYAASNITLSQADTGTYTQKQMALESVLTPIYEQYGSIIQRPQAQVVNDIISYAQENGTTLEEAFNKNFMDYLKAKPAYKAMQNQLANTEPNIQVIGEDSDGNKIYGYWDSATGTLKSTGYGSSGGGSVSGSDSVSNFKSLLASEGYTTGSVIRSGGCGTIVNDYLASVGDNLHLSEANDIAPYATSKTASVGAVAYFSGTKADGTSWGTTATQEHGHVAIVESTSGDTITVLESNEGTGIREVTYNKSDVTGYYVPSGVSSSSSTDDALYQAKVLAWIPTQLRNTEVEKEWYMDIANTMKEKGYDAFEAAMSIIGFDITNDSSEAKATKEKILDSLESIGDGSAYDSAVLAGMAKSINSGNYSQALNSLENVVSNYMTKSGGVDRTSMSKAATALSNLNKFKASSYWGGVKGTLERVIGKEGISTDDFDRWTGELRTALEGLGVSNVDGYIPQITWTKDTFNNHMTSLQNELLSQYNQQRSLYGLPSVTLSSLLGNTSLATIYGVNSEGEALSIF